MYVFLYDKTGKATISAIVLIVESRSYVCSTRCPIPSPARLTAGHGGDVDLRVLVGLEAFAKVSMRCRRWCHPGRRIVVRETDRRSSSRRVHDGNPSDHWHHRLTATHYP